MEERTWWSINVTGYGRFEYFGYEYEAEEMREHKADWEGGRGTMRRAKKDEIEGFRAEVRKLTPNHGWDRTCPRVEASFADAYDGRIPVDILEDMQRVRATFVEDEE